MPKLTKSITVKPYLLSPGVRGTGEKGGFTDQETGDIVNEIEKVLPGYIDAGWGNVGRLGHTLKRKMDLSWTKS